MNAATIAHQALTNAQAVANATLWPWVIALEYAPPGGPTISRIMIEQRTLADMPTPEDALPEGSTLHRVEVFPATRFDDMRPAGRWKYKAHYAAYLKWRLAHALGKKVEDLIPWEELDAIALDMKVQRWASVGPVWQGD